MLTGVVVKVGEQYVTLSLKEARELKESLSRLVPDEQISYPTIDERVWRTFPNNHMGEQDG